MRKTTRLVGILSPALLAGLLAGCALFAVRTGEEPLSPVERDAAEAIAAGPAGCGRLTALIPRLEAASDAVQASATLQAGECAEISDDGKKALEWYGLVVERFPHVIFEASGGSYSAAAEARRRMTLLRGPTDWFSNDLEALASRIETAVNDGDGDRLIRSASRADFAVGALESGWTYAEPNDAIEQLLSRPRGRIHFGPRVRNPFSGGAQKDLLVETTGWDGSTSYLYLWYRFDERRGWEWAGWLESGRALPPDQNEPSSSGSSLIRR